MKEIIFHALLRLQLVGDDDEEDGEEDEEELNSTTSLASTSNVASTSNAASTSIAASTSNAASTSTSTIARDFRKEYEDEKLRNAEMRDRLHELNKHLIKFLTFK